MRQNVDGTLEVQQEINFVLCAFSVGHIKYKLHWYPTLVVKRLFWAKLDFSPYDLKSHFNNTAVDGKQATLEWA